MTDKATEVSKLLAPTVASLGVELMGAEYLPSPGGAVLRLYIDVPADDVSVDADGQPRCVTIEECEAVSREVSAQLDVEDPISGNYTLEVSSPGIDRLLFTPAHYQRFLGETAKVSLRLPQDGRRRLQGRIERIEAGTVVLVVDGKEFPLSFDNIDKARLVPDWAALGLAPSKADTTPRLDKVKPDKARPDNARPGTAGNNTTGREPRPARQKTKSTNKPAADKPTRAE